MSEQDIAVLMSRVQDIYDDVRLMKKAMVLSGGGGALGALALGITIV